MVLSLSEEAKAAGFSLSALPVTASTNQDALEALRAGADRFWIVADEQVAGRGRHGRVWVSKPGNLYASLGLRAPCPSAQTPLLGFVAGVALADAICDIAPHLEGGIRLKWPNDLLLNGAKCAGMLLEGTILPGNVQAVAIGIGVNIAHCPEGLDQPASCLAPETVPSDFGQITRDMLLAALSRRVTETMQVFVHGEGFAQIRNRWLAHALPIGERLRVRLPVGEHSGTFAGLSEAGHLLLATQSGQETIMVGDVFPE